ncbi:MAG: hypothetical protein LBT59_16465, partial [Clostridiales bacterium]|nr:hypothetical protein [Clostridiales bacterium]
ALPQEEKTKVAYALNLCAVSISQIIDSKDIIVLKQEREAILNNLNMQNFVKHPALLEVLKQILDTVTYLEIQAGDLGFVEKEYQQKLKNAIWSAMPNPGMLFTGNPASIAIAVAAQIGTGYMNYRRNKSQYSLDKDKSEWTLRRHELEQLYGLKAKLFETSWKLSEDYDFDDRFRLSPKQLSRYSEALLDPDPLKRFERLDVMSERFAAFPPFWYHKGNAAMEVFRGAQYASFSAGYRNEALQAYREYHKSHFEFLREDIVAASCCIEHLSLLEPNNPEVETLLKKALRLAGDNYDILQLSILVNLQLKKFDDCILPLREMIANDYNIGLNGILLSRIYFAKSSRNEYETLKAIAGEENVLQWTDNADLSEKLLVDARKAKLSDEYQAMARRIVFKLRTSKSSVNANAICDSFAAISSSLQKFLSNNKALAESFKFAESKLKTAVVSASADNISAFSVEAQRLSSEILTAGFTLQIAEEAPKLIDKMREVAK